MWRIGGSAREGYSEDATGHVLLRAEPNYSTSRAMRTPDMLLFLEAFGHARNVLSLGSWPDGKRIGFHRRT